MTNAFPKDTSKFNLIVSDFDGTLAGSDHVVVPAVVKAVRRWIDNGKRFTIATGRQYLMLDEECKKLGLKDPVVVRGGAEVVDPVSGEILHSEYIAKADVSKILSLFTENDVFLFSIEQNDVIYANLELTVAFDKITFRDVSEFKLDTVPKIHVKLKDPRYLNKANGLIKKLMHALPSVHAMATHNKQFGIGWDITSVKASKLHGIVKVMEILNVKREEIVGVGDSYNDFPLLEAAQLKVAMGNAHDELKAVADVIVPSHEDDGVAYLIDKLLK